MIRYDLPMGDYRAHPAVSASDLKNMQRSAAYARLRPSKPSDAKDWGTAVHTAILEPDELLVRYGLDPESPKGGYPQGWRNSTAYKEQAAAELARGYVGLLPRAKLDSLARIAEQVSRHDIGKLLHSLPGHREASVFTVDGPTELACKLRPDWLIPGARTAVDVKSAVDHSPAAFARACKTYGYHITAAFYLDKLGEECGVEHYPFLVVNSEEPHEIAAYTLDHDSIEQGRFEYRQLLKRYADCLKADRWPSGSGVIEELRLPEWAITYHEER